MPMLYFPFQRKYQVLVSVILNCMFMSDSLGLQLRQQISNSDISAIMKLKIWQSFYIIYI